MWDMSSNFNNTVWGVSGATGFTSNPSGDVHTSIWSNNAHGGWGNSNVHSNAFDNNIHGHSGLSTIHGTSSQNDVFGNPSL